MRLACVVGETVENPSGAYGGDGLLSRIAFAANNKPFKANPDVKVGDAAKRQHINYGTWSHLNKDYPKLDTYCPQNVTLLWRSLEYIDTVPQEGVIKPADAHAMELYNFCDMESFIPLESEISNINLIVRKVDFNSDNEAVGAHVDYMPLSALSGTSIPEDTQKTYLSSVNDIVLQDTNGQDVLVRQLYNFHDPSTEDIQIGPSWGGQNDLTSLTEYDFVIRRPNGGHAFIDYAKLSVHLSVDSQGDANQKSIDWLDDNGVKELQLYHFDVDEFKRAKLSSDHFLVRRTNGNRTYLEYVMLSALSGDGSNHTADSNIQKSNSLQLVEDDDDGVFYRMYNFEKDGEKTIISAKFGDTVALSDEIVVRKNGANGEINYLSAGLYLPNPTDTISVDTDVAAWKQRSVEHRKANGVDALQIYNFDDDVVV